MRISAFSMLALGFGLVGFQLSACSNSSEDCNATATCVSSAGSSSTAGSAGKSNGTGGGDDGGAPAGGTPSVGGSSNTSGTSGTSGTMGVGGEGGSGSSACTGDVADDAACWTTNAYGVFVSSDSGDDAAGDGTQEAPFKTITKGITSAAGKNVYVCAGADDYSEKVTLSAATTTDGLRIYGGFECSTWTYATTRSAQVVSPSNIALRIDGLKKGAYIENLHFQAADGAGLDASSYGAFVTSSKGVMLKRVELKAGKGLKGGDGAAGGTTPNAADAGAAQNGKPAECGGTPTSADGGAWAAAVCGSRGGDGGKAVLDTDGADGFSGTPTANLEPPSPPNKGAGSSAIGGDAAPGTKGAKGNPGPLGVGADAVGTFASGGFSAADGRDGGTGFAGQGGGGGGASKGSASCRGASGGAGGLGGCGGKPGFGGRGGGASVGIFSSASAVVLDACAITSGKGGDAGGGGNAGGGGGGGSGGLVGQGSQGNGIGLSGQGGQGGPGGNGGSGSGGSGGPSYALVFSGAKPIYDAVDTTLTAGKGGAGGVGGKVLTAKAPDGAIGASANELEVN